MSEKFDPRIHVGERYGIYVIEDVLPEDQKDKSGHWLYKAVCQECGFEKINTYGRIKSKIIEKCTHAHKYQQRFCLNCGKEIPIGSMKPNEYNQRKFCSHSCRASYNNSLREKKYNYCLNCGAKTSTKNKYCSAKCQWDYLQKEWEKKWLAGEVDGNNNSEWIETKDRVRTYLFNKYNSKCSQCGWGEINPYTNTIPLEIHHIDGDPYNTVPENLDLLCPNCHSLTDTYRGANKGNGRKKPLVLRPIQVDI